MSKLRTLIVALIALAFSLPAIARPGRGSPAAPGSQWGNRARAARDHTLRKQLLKEILADPKNETTVQNTTARTAAPEIAEPAATTAEPVAAPTTPPAPETALPTPEKKEPEVALKKELGTAVASVPTWPVIGLSLLLAGVLWWLKKGKRLQTAGASIQKIASVPLGGKRSLALVEVMGKKLLLGLSEKNVSLLTPIESAGLEPAAVHQRPLGRNGEPSTPVPELAPAAAERDDYFENELKAMLDVADSRDSFGAAEEHDLARKIRAMRGA